MTRVVIQLDAPYVRNILNDLGPEVEVEVANGVLANLMNDWVKPLLEKEVGQKILTTLRGALEQHLVTYIGTLSDGWSSNKVTLNPRFMEQVQEVAASLRVTFHREALALIASEVALQSVKFQEMVAEEVARRMGPAFQQAVSQEVERRLKEVSLTVAAMGRSDHGKP